MTTRYRVSLFVLALASIVSIHQPSSRLVAQVLTLKSVENASQMSSLRAEAGLKYFESWFVEVDKQQIGEILRLRPQHITLDVPREIQFPSRIELEAFEILTPDAKVYVVGAEGNREMPFRQRWLSYRGRLPGDERSRVIVNITPDGIDAAVDSRGGRYYIRMAQGPAKDGLLSAFLFPASALKSVAPFLCGVSQTQARTTHEEAILYELRQRHQPQPKPPSFRQQSAIPDAQPLNRALQFGPAISTDTIEVRVALEGDYELFLAMGSSEQAALDLMMSTATFASGVYLDETGVMLTVPFIRVWTTEVGHPYGHIDLFKTMEQFMSYWKQSMNHVDRTIAHLFTNAARWTNVSGFVGIAQLDALCNYQIGYGVTDVRQPQGDGHLMTFTHEVGHNFGARHTHSCFWPGGPVDLCAPIEDGGCYTGPIVQSEGTIMSYCATRNFEFGQAVSELIRRNAEFAVCAPSIPQLAVAVEDSSFLNELYATTGGAAWNANTNWDSGPVFGRTGVVVRGGRVIGLTLPANNLSGPIPSSISNLTALRVLNLSGRSKHHSPYVAFPDPTTDVANGNKLTGSIPSSIAQITSLEELDLSNNLLTGDLPAGITSMTQLRALNLSENFSLTGTIPQAVGNLTNLEMLDLWRTGITGTIPSSIGNLTNLRVLILSEMLGIVGGQLARLSGPIPSEL
ncbi:MAG: zinc-dependent metalloprotease family protein, partial [Bacteroidota bacterium]